VLVAKKPEEPKPVDPAAAGIKGTIHKPKAVPGAPGAAPAPGVKAGDKKAVKSEKLSSSWADDAKKRSALKPGARAPAGGNRPGWRWTWALAALSIAAGYSALDEIHQAFVISRTRVTGKEDST